MANNVTNAVKGTSITSSAQAKKNCHKKSKKKANLNATNVKGSVTKVVKGHPKSSAARTKTNFPKKTKKKAKLITANDYSKCCGTNLDSGDFAYFASIVDDIKRGLKLMDLKCM